MDYFDFMKKEVKSAKSVVNMLERFLSDIKSKN